ncbi:MAG: UDP-N-acetylglucosamine 2-epimerase (non-hydrolyzing) [Elusimicrobia bacterium]|nr:UDP-N-acetylglucosamine 2-epimerase (non-hydrolyzing) [Elusimicrobiota bacterium]
MKKKVLFVFGTRPEAIKMAPLVHAFKAQSSLFKTVVCVTAQHRQMLDEVLELFKIKPDYDLNIMQDGQTLYHITASALCRMEKVLSDEKPDMVLVHGDTTTTFAAALAAFYQKIPVAHVEAGLRTYDRYQPFPEEANRMLTDALCDLYFAPTATSRAALLKENISREKIFITGNTVIDALHMALAKKKPVANVILKKLLASRVFGPAAPLVLVTSHRRENFGAPMENVFHALNDAARVHPAMTIVYPVHLNPRVQEPAHRILGHTANIVLLPPVNYTDLAAAMYRSSFVVTDSGGIQEEAPALGKPVLVLRAVTERPEAVKSGTVRLIGTNRKKVFDEVCRLIGDTRQYQRMAHAVNPYGDGKAAVRSVQAVAYYFKMRSKKPTEFRP